MNTDSQNTKIAEHLKAGKGISQQLAISMFKCYRLGARIYDLKQKGMEIYTQMVEHAGSRFALYYMKNSPHYQAYNMSKTVHKDSENLA